jgi:RNA polymerase sigma-70 factor (ECF subfamily)
MMTSFDDSSSALIPAIASGDTTAFEELYDRYSSIVYALLLRMLADTDDAREVLQETFLQIWNRAAMFDRSRGTEAAWLLSIARSRGIDRIRARKTRGNRESDAGREISIRSESVDREQGVQLAILSQEQRAVRDALKDLPDTQRVALEMAYFDGMSQSEIAETLSEPLGTVKTRMQLGMKKLRERLKSTLRP